MNKTKIEWCDYTWNPVTGCLHGCPYCYARKTAENPFYHKAFPYGFEPHFYPARLNDPVKMKKPQTIFVCSMADLFGEWVPDAWIKDVLSACSWAPQHTYIFLTKNPARYLKIPGLFFTENMWFGATDDGLPNVNGYHTISALQSLPHENKFISFEPLLGNFGPLDLTGIKQVIIGAQTNPSVEVTAEMMLPIGAATCPGVVPTIKMFNKDSMPKWAKCRRELCWQVHK